MDSLRFDADDTTLILLCAAGSPPSILYWGEKLSARVNSDEIVRLGTRGGVPGNADVHIPASLAFEPGLGLAGPCGFSAQRRGKDWGSRFDVVEVELHPTGVTLICRDHRTKLSLTYKIILDPASSILTITTILTNEGAVTLELGDMATAFLPIPQSMTEIIGFTGRWSNEFQRERLARFSGAYVRENWRGRTSHDSFPAVIACTPTTNENSGEAYGLHLAWSGNHRVRIDTLSDGRVFASLAALLLPGEIRLEPGETYHSPQIVAAYSSSGLAALSRSFHRYVRSDLLRPLTRARPRPVHYNSWEAVYFNHDLEQLKAIATRAAEIGVERFVLDDGWFGGRRNDEAGLGDWTVSDAVYPDGLTPLIDHVTGLGMEMGLWLEPEMVNPDSDLFRAHPDWVLLVEGIPQTPFRNQYVLDISRQEVADHLFGQIDAILTNHDIGYLKWDMNRDLNHPGNVQGRPRAHAQITALYTLIDRVRAKHPRVEIETCSSGGGRADMGILAHTDRIWTSDTNDALDRQLIQRGASFFLPLEVLGSHVGPRRCHVTGRTVSMAMRAGTALMGHMGLELNLLTEPEGDIVVLKAAIALYKDHRALLHAGDFQRLDLPEYLNGIGVVSRDRLEALYSVAVLTGHSATLPCRLFFAGLDPVRDYQVRLIWPANWRSKSLPSVMDSLDLGGDGATLCGEALMAVGLQMPLAAPQTVLLFHLNCI